MKCAGCGFPHPPHELTHGRCLRCADSNLREALVRLLAFHPESPETGAELPRESWTPGYRAAVEAAEAALTDPA